MDCPARSVSTADLGIPGWIEWIASICMRQRRDLSSLPPTFQTSVAMQRMATVHRSHRCGFRAGTIAAASDRGASSSADPPPRRRSFGGMNTFIPLP
jgi:hypothetical protein